MEFKEQIRQIKSDFFSLRNGEIADTLRKAGSPYKIIFGLQMPQLEQIAKHNQGIVLNLQNGCGQMIQREKVRYLQQWYIP